MTERTGSNKSEQYTLSIRLRADGFSFALVNPLGEEEAAPFEYRVDESLSLTANLKRAFQELEWLHRTFRQVNVLMVTPRYTFIPMEFFEDDRVETIFYYNLSPCENEQVCYNILHKSNIVVLFGMDRSACEWLQGTFPQVSFFAQASPLIEYFAAKSRLGNCRKLYADLSEKQVQLFAFDRGRLLLGNSIACSDAADYLYHILYVWKSLGLDQERDELHLTGNLINREHLLPELRKYIRQVFIMNPATNIDFQAIKACE